MTPAINALKKQGIPFATHKYQHSPEAESYGVEAAILLQLPPERVFKTLVVCLDKDVKQLAVGIVPVATSLDMKLMAVACQAKKADMALVVHAEKVTGYVSGGISPFGQKRPLMTILDQSAQQFDTIFVSGGRRGLEIELNPEDLLKACSAQFFTICR